ncbi:MAG: TIGR04282 family arsenosugar biosynthesis glycosyltransferase [Hyphomonadaceae bacterium]
MIRPTLIVMAKAPRLGHGKQRLAADIGALEALRINRALHAHTMREARDPRWRTLLCVTPDSAIHARVDVWPAGVARCGQGAGDLGERMARALSPLRRVAMIGADCPGLRRAHIAQAFRVLRQSRFVLGPSEDGGFWLLAARSGLEAARAMRDVRWSSAHTAADVIANLPERPLMLPLLYDIDTAADLARWTQG